MNLRKVTKLPEYEGFPLNQNGEKVGLYVAILDNILNQKDAMLSYHGKVFGIRFDLRFSEEMELDPKDESKVISDFFYKLKQLLSAKKSGSLKRIAYVWVKEVEKAKHGHFHCILYVDGNKIRKTGTQKAGIHSLICNAWNSITGAPSGCVEMCDSHMLTRDIDSQQEFVYHVSYLAKSRGKGLHAGLKNHGRSRLKSKA